MRYGGEIIVGEDYVGRFFGDVGASFAHGYANVGSLRVPLYNKERSEFC